MFDKILSRLGACLDRNNLPYMIIGGQAVLLYGEPRLTRDIDITLGADTAHLDRLLLVVEQMSLRPLPQDTAAFVRETMVLPTLDETTGIRVDFIFSWTPYEAQAIKRARKVDVLGYALAFASVEDLIIHKIFAGRPRDLEDVRTILIKNRDMDRQYVEKWLREFDAATDDKIYLRTFHGLLPPL